MLHVLITNHMFPCTLTVNRDNYQLWFQYFCIFVRVQRKLGYLLDGLADTKDSCYSDQLTNDYYFITWLLSSMKEKVSYRVMFFKTVKEIYDTLEKVQNSEKNISRIFDSSIFHPPAGRDVDSCLLFSDSQYLSSDSQYLRRTEGLPTSDN